MSAAVLVALCLAGGAGSAVRFVVDGEVHRRWSRDLPRGTFLINTTGSLLLGLLTGWAAATSGSVLLAVAGTGFCGGYTTFSTASVETVRLLQRGAVRSALANGVGMLVACVALAALGTAVGTALA